MLERRESKEMSFSDVQCRLRELGYYEDLLGEGPRRATLAALERFQRERGLQVTRRADPLTANALRGSAPSN
jgi:peptidoglycan hydrolase-like protein with peptidoglycan-binding domain